ncbi:flagellar hook-basal body complex protein FliE [Desulfolucanica intricata]|uniref:flagellar hook-basal body complex protein FliE n=1 Tax=Desulfolucanica intricata TaxID=1285191 RepID=UPI0008342884|nr:flagellar hook-basal body complex protein FliE [Desulfolucanica intricata]
MFISPAGVPLLTPQQQANKSAGTGDDFGSFLAEAINKVNRSQVQADNLTEKFLIGKVEDLHQVVIASEKAKLNIQLAVQVRNKIVEAYQEISRMQI